MGLGSTAKKIQTLADRAEQLYEQLIELRERVIKLEEATETTSERVEELAGEQRQQQALLKAIADEHDIDVEAVLAEAAINETESAPDREGASEADT